MKPSKQSSESWEEKYDNFIKDRVHYIAVDRNDPSIGHYAREDIKEFIRYVVKSETDKARSEAVDNWFSDVKPIILIEDKKTGKILDMLDLIPTDDRVIVMHSGAFEYKSSNGKERAEHIKKLQITKSK